MSAATPLLWSAHATPGRSMSRDALPPPHPAGSPGSARVKIKVAMTTPMMLGTAPASRRPIMLSAAKFRMGDAASLFAELAKVELAVEPVLIPADIFLHGDIQVGLIEWHAWD